MNKDLIQQAAEKRDEEISLILYKETYGHIPFNMGGNKEAAIILLAFKKALAIGAAKERERMKGFVEWVYTNQKHYPSIDGKFVWMDAEDKEYTTDELINLYQNKEG